MNDVREMMEQAALAWLVDRVGEAIEAVGPTRAAELRAWLAQMPCDDRHKADAPKVDDGHPFLVGEGPKWISAADEQPSVGRAIELCNQRGDVVKMTRMPYDPPIAAGRHWRYI